MWDLRGVSGVGHAIAVPSQRRGSEDLGVHESLESLSGVLLGNRENVVLQTPPVSNVAHAAVASCICVPWLRQQSQPPT